ncbi:hypothetical protein [Kaistia granuli]|uniref:hypothetical protein n=1 Tax=Kaistia granuli TaxID=363259 RepID=UPI00036C4155|nr:hypothetical protein [Kaistia granuli]
MTDLHMSHRFYQSEDGAEWLLRTWEPDYPTKIRFIDVGPDRDALLANARKFWVEYIEPMRARRQENEARLERDRADRAAKKAAKASAPIPATAA